MSVIGKVHLPYLLDIHKYKVYSQLLNQTGCGFYIFESFPIFVSVKGLGLWQTYLMKVFRFYP